MPLVIAVVARFLPLSLDLYIRTHRATNRRSLCPHMHGYHTRNAFAFTRVAPLDAPPKNQISPQASRAIHFQQRQGLIP
jgi:hypothetical protein